jgi:small subunit ribosomal protein S18
MYCRHKIDDIDYKQFTNLRVLITDKGKIRSRRVTGLCRRHQNQAATAIKRAREVALLPYAGA